MFFGWICDVFYMYFILYIISYAFCTQNISKWCIWSIEHKRQIQNGKIYFEFVYILLGALCNINMMLSKIYFSMYNWYIRLYTNASVLLVHLGKFMLQVIYCHGIQILFFSIFFQSINNNTKTVKSTAQYCKNYTNFLRFFAN